MITFYVEGYNSLNNDLKNSISDDSIINLLELDTFDYCELTDIPFIRRKILFVINKVNLSNSTRDELISFNNFLSKIQEQQKKAFWI